MLTRNPGVRLIETDTPGIARVEVLDPESRYSLTWDRFMRLFNTAVQVRSAAGRGSTILDIGGFDGALALFLDDYTVDLIDPVTTGATGTAVPAPDRTYDTVVSIDALEHVPPEHRSTFIEEACRVAASHCLINFPAPRTIKAQRLAFELTGNDLVREHVEWPLPDAHEVSRRMHDLGFDCRTVEHTSLAVWLCQYLLQTAAPAISERSCRYLTEAHLHEPHSGALYDLIVGERRDRTQ